MDLATILEFIDTGHNVLLAASSDVSDAMRTLAAEVGVDMDERGSSVLDHQGAQPTLIASTELSAHLHKAVLGSSVDPQVRAAQARTPPCSRSLRALAARPSGMRPCPPMPART